MKPLADVIVVFGAPNDDSGRLSEIALSRCRLALDFYRSYQRPLLPTGGWGRHFNTAPRPHHEYMTAWFANHGVRADHLLAGLDSGNTFDDVVLTAEVLRGLGAAGLVVTSDFHVDRASLLFEREAVDLMVEITGADSQLAADELDALLRHERSAIAKLRKTP